MSAAKEIESFYDAALSCPDTASVNITSLQNTGTAWGAVTGRSIKLKRVSLAIKLNASFDADDEFTFILRRIGSVTSVVPLVGVPVDADAGDVFVVNIDLKEGILYPVDEAVIFAVHGSTVPVTGTVSVEGILMGEVV